MSIIVIIMLLLLLSHDDVVLFPIDPRIVISRLLQYYDPPRIGQRIDHLIRMIDIFPSRLFLPRVVVEDGFRQIAKIVTVRTIIIIIIEFVVVVIGSCRRSTHAGVDRILRWSEGPRQYLL